MNKGLANISTSKNERLVYGWLADFQNICHYSPWSLLHGASLPIYERKLVDAEKLVWWLKKGETKYTSFLLYIFCSFLIKCQEFTQETNVATPI